MSIPASLAVSKLRYPESEEPLTAGHVSVPEDDTEESANGLHAFANGTWLGLKIAAMIMGTQMCIIAFIALIDGLLTWWGNYLNISEGLTIEFILGYIMYPVSFLIGVSRKGDDIYKVAQLIGLKLIGTLPALSCTKGRLLICMQQMSSLPSPSSPRTPPTQPSLPAQGSLLPMRCAVSPTSARLEPKSVCFSKLRQDVVGMSAGSPSRRC
jgi:hypothetical protein